jgi:tryptophanase
MSDMISCSNCSKQYTIGSKKAVNEFVDKTTQKYTLDDPRAYNDYCRDCNKEYYNEKDIDEIIDEMQKYARPNSYDQEFIADDDEIEEAQETDEEESESSELNG